MKLKNSFHRVKIGKLHFNMLGWFHISSITLKIPWIRKTLVIWGKRK